MGYMEGDGSDVLYPKKRLGGYYYAIVPIPVGDCPWKWILSYQHYLLLGTAHYSHIEHCKSNY